MVAKKKKLERKYVVRAELSNFELAKAKSALRLEISCEGEPVGELELGRGSLIWWSAHQVKGRRIRWSKFAEMMDQLAFGKRNRKRRSARQTED